MQGNQEVFQDAMARAREIAQKLAANAPVSHQNTSLKRPNNDEDGSNKRPALDSSNVNMNDLPPALRAQMIAQKLNAQLGVVTPASSSSPLTSSSTFHEDYQIPDKFVGLVIGKNGEQIVRIQEDSGCKVKISNIRPDPVPGGSNPPDRVANLSGTREAIEKAKKIIDDIVSRGKAAHGAPAGLNAYSMGGIGAKSIEVMLPSAKCGLIIGKGGETIRRISEELGVKMFVAQELTNIDGIEHKPLKITGDPDRVERAKQHVLGIVDRSAPGTNRNGTTTSNDYGSRTSGGSMNGLCNEATFNVPYEKSGVIIGKGGESIKEICRRSGAFIEIDKTYIPPVGNSRERLFKIRGTPDQIVLAQQLMYEKALNSPAGPGDLLPPLQFQQKFNLPLVGAGPSDSWPGTTTDPYGTNSSSSTSDMYSQWANAYGQWPQMNSYDDGAGKSSNNPSLSSSTNNPAGANAMDPAWLAYYQSMNFYNMMQSSMTGNTTSTSSSSSSNTTDTTSSTTANMNASSTTTTSSSGGQTDYTQQWIEYYRSIGQNDLADQIAQQAKENGGATGTTPAAPSATAAAASTMSSQDAWAAFAQQWANSHMATNPTNGQSSSNTH